MSENPPETRRDGVVHSWDLLIAFFGGTFVGSILAFVVGIAVLVYASFHGFQPTSENITAFTRTSMPFMMALLVISDFGVLAGTWLVARWRFERPIAHFFPPAGVKAVALAGLSGALMSAAMNGANEWLDRAGWVKFTQSDFDRLTIPHTPVEFVLAIAVIALFAPLVEEYFFRGIFLSWMRKRSGPWLSTMVTALVFALIHGHLWLHPGFQGWLLTGEIALIGVALAQWVVRTGSLRTSFATHAGFNAVAVLFTYLIPT